MQTNIMSTKANFLLRSVENDLSRLSNLNRTSHRDVYTDFQYSGYGPEGFHEASSAYDEESNTYDEESTVDTSYNTANAIRNSIDEIFMEGMNESLQQGAQQNSSQQNNQQGAQQNSSQQKTQQSNQQKTQTSQQKQQQPPNIQSIQSNQRNLQTQQTQGQTRGQTQLQRGQTNKSTVQGSIIDEVLGTINNKPAYSPYEFNLSTSRDKTYDKDLKYLISKKLNDLTDSHANSDKLSNKHLFLSDSNVSSVAKNIYLNHSRNGGKTLFCDLLKIIPPMMKEFAEKNNIDSIDTVNNAYSNFLEVLKFTNEAFIKYSADMFSYDGLVNPYKITVGLSDGNKREQKAPTDLLASDYDKLHLWREYNVYTTKDKFRYHNAIPIWQKSMHKRHVHQGDGYRSTSEDSSREAPIYGYDMSQLTKSY